MGEAEDVVATGLLVSYATIAMPFLLNDPPRVYHRRRRTYTRELLLALLWSSGTPAMTGADFENT